MKVRQIELKKNLHTTNHLVYTDAMSSIASCKFIPSTMIILEKCEVNETGLVSYIKINYAVSEFTH